ncbi:MAG: glucose-6-phosphate isomerase [Verrucomicrobia bacterium]|nr:MAG: glucose-6-phosphate isomerase [Verrucomicrobiota bacterium]
MSWETFTKHNHVFPEVGLSLDLSRIGISDTFLAEMQPRLDKAFAAMAELEKGAIANPDENRMVGHYWLRAPKLAPTAEITAEIEQTLERIKKLAADVHAGTIAGADGRFENLLVIGIGGSALGPQFVAHALGYPKTDRMRVFFFDNTDPDGIDLVLAALEGQLGKTLCVVISKSGGTPETRNGMLEAQAAYKAAGLEFAKHAVAITGVGSKLDKVAESEGWIARFPMWDWVGGRTSETAAVGLLPAALQGLDIDGLLAGAAAMDAVTRIPERDKNPAALLALAWYHATDGRGKKDMVILPYKDRLLLFSRYLQQLIMESLGKEFDLDGNVVNQGIAVYGNKGSTDQHAYVQQLREGVPNFFVTFIEVLRDREGDSIEVEPGVTSGDFLAGFLLGTRDALSEKDRGSITITVEDVSARNVGALIALYERAVGLYASLININAYHQPGVEAGKKAAAGALALQGEILATLREAGTALTAPQIAEKLGKPAETERIFRILTHLAANPGRGVTRTPAAVWHEAAFAIAG